VSIWKSNSGQETGVGGAEYKTHRTTIYGIYMVKILFGFEEKEEKRRFGFV